MASFDGLRPLQVTCHCSLCSLAKNFVRSFVRSLYVMDGQTNGRTRDDSKYRASIASRGKLCVGYDVETMQESYIYLLECFEYWTKALDEGFALITISR